MEGKPQNDQFHCQTFHSEHMIELEFEQIECFPLRIWIFHFVYFGIVIWAEVKNQILLQRIWVFEKELFTINFMDTHDCSQSVHDFVMIVILSLSWKC